MFHTNIVLLKNQVHKQVLQDILDYNISGMYNTNCTPRLVCGRDKIYTFRIQRSTVTIGSLRKFLIFALHKTVYFYILCTSGDGFPVVDVAQHGKAGCLMPETANSLWSDFHLLADCLFREHSKGITRLIPELITHTYAHGSTDQFAA